MTNDGRRALIVAEVGSVHDGSFGNAERLLATAAACGADAVKFQTHLAAAETVRGAPAPPYFDGEPRYEYFDRTGFTEAQWATLAEACHANGVEFISSPFSIEATELLDRVGVDRYKVASGEVTNVPLLDAVAATGRPVILSSGMSSWAELDRAVEALRRHDVPVTVLQCTSEYPCPYERVGLNVLAEMAERYGLPVGLSDHTATIFAPVAAVALGATMIEKHLTFSRRMYGSDAKHSLEPDEFAQMVEGIRAAEAMCGSRVDKADVSHVAHMKVIFEKSVVAVVPIAEGTTITAAMLGTKKPGNGISPVRLPSLVGRRAARTIPVDHLLSEADLVSE